LKSFTYTDFFYRSTLYFALAVALTATLGSLYFSEVRHYIPCNLCWYQRICMYPLVIVLAVGLLRQDIHLPFYILPLSLVGQGIATYHYLLEKTNIFAAPTSCQVGVPCTTPWINWAGFITIPFLSMCAFFLITVLCLIALTTGEPEADEYATVPWFQVATVVVLVVVAFVLIYNYDPVRTAATLSLTIPATGEMTHIHDTATPQLSTALSETFTVNSTANITATETQTDPETASLGQQLYRANCAACHGADAQGLANLGTSLVASPIIQEQSDDEILAYVRKGLPASDPANTTGIAMPPSGGNPSLQDKEILAIVTYLRTH
jgi:disulfide bond formation protein DsbB